MLACYSRDFDTILKKDEISQDIVYKKYKDESEYPMKAVVMGREFEATEGEGRLALDTQTVYLKLDFEPTIYDRVQILEPDENGVLKVAEEYDVKSWEKQVSRYKMSVERNKRSTNAHTMGRRR